MEYPNRFFDIAGSEFGCESVGLHDDCMLLLKNVEWD